MKKKRKFIVTAVVLSVGYLNFSSSDLITHYSSYDEYSVPSIVQSTNAEHSETENLNRDTTFNASFEEERRIISLIETISTSDVDALVLQKEVKSYVLNLDRILSIINYLEIKEDDNLLILVARMYINLVSDRPAKIIEKLVTYCLSSKNVSTNSFGVDLLSLHISYTGFQKFLEKDFSHPFLKRKIDQLKREVLL